MTRVTRDQLLDWQSYVDRRDEIVAAVLPVKEARRVHVGEALTLLFENADTVRYQVQEMMRVEQIVREADIEHELRTYNELLGGPGELGATLLVEIDDPARREELLPRWLDLPERLYAELEDGTRVRPIFDDRQRDGRRISTVQFLKFPVGGAVPVALGADHPELTAETRLDEATRAALADDLAAASV